MHQGKQAKKCAHLSDPPRADYYSCIGMTAKNNIVELFDLDQIDNVLNVSGKIDLHAK
jgi:hypothetical protein